MGTIVNYPGAVSRDQRLKNGEIPSILDWNAVTGKGTNDDTSDLNALLAQAPRGGMAHLPKGVYAHTGNLVLPNKPLILFGDGSMKPQDWWQRVGPVAPDPANTTNLGSVLWNTAATQHFDPVTFVDTQLSFKDLGFYGGSGVIKVPNLSTSVNLHIENIFAMFCTGVAFEIGEDDTTGDAYFTSVLRSWFYNCGTAILNHFNCDLQVDEQCVFQDCTMRALDIRGSNTKIANSFFMGNNGAEEDILLTPTGNTLAHVLYMVKLFNNKFGNENAIDGETRVKVRVGNPAIKAANPDYFVLDLQSRGNTYVGTAPTPGNPTACVALHSPLVNSSFDDHFMNSTYAIDDSDAASTSGLGATNRFDGRLTSGIIPFKAGGISFSDIRCNYGVLAESQPSAKDHLRIQNLISLSEAIDGWSLFNATVTTGQSDPFGETRACRINKTGAFGSVGIGLTTTADGTVVLSVWLKAGSVAKCTVEIQDGSSNVLARLPLGLEDVWRRCSVRLVGIPAATTLAAVIFPDEPATATAVTIFVFGAQINSGDEASGYLKTTGSAISGTYGLRAPHDLSVGRDALIDRNTTVAGTLAVTGDASSAIQTFTTGSKAINTFAYMALLQTALGFGVRLILNNDSTLRIQRTADGFSTLTDTPIQLNSAGEIVLQKALHLLDNVVSRILLIDGAGKVVSGKLDPTSANHIDPSGLTDNVMIKRSGSVLASAAATDLPSGISATKLSTGVVDNAEFDTLNGVTSGIQGQIDALQTQINAIVAKYGVTGNITIPALTGGGAPGNIDFVDGWVTGWTNPT